MDIGSRPHIRADPHGVNPTGINPHIVPEIYRSGEPVEIVAGVVVVRVGFAWLGCHQPQIIPRVCVDVDVDTQPDRLVLLWALLGPKKSRSKQSEKNEPKGSHVHGLEIFCDEPQDRPGALPFTAARCVSHSCF